VLPKNKWLGRLHGSVDENDEVHTNSVWKILISVRLPGSDHVAFSVVPSAPYVAKKPDPGRGIHGEAWLGTVVHTRCGLVVDIEHHGTRKDADERWCLDWHGCTDDKLIVNPSRPQRPSSVLVGNALEPTLQLKLCLWQRTDIHLRMHMLKLLLIIDAVPG